ncbi:DUF1045 domain-containing protein [Pontibaca salina]|uniref:DUF1045 domain-containing protein n=1 Tax=Pontibaca salina TaxID=2795731 RepID=A0A934HMV2_9RHOB|nr:DUF1045 domain-containing protein [Pontibaca salina]MBI6628502.1 DUF1045 domain-containing protein [Pontibaca salina]
MDHFRRYAIYFLPQRAAWSDFAASWLGWDAVQGRTLAHPDVPGLPLSLAQITARPRRYGLHATIKAPFYLAENTTAAALCNATDALCAALAPVELGGLRIGRMGSFLALLAQEDSAALSDLAAKVVAGLDDFRAPPSDAELTRRRAARLDPQQERLLLRWGYPNVMERFRFHITLTGRIHRHNLEPVQIALTQTLEPILPQPFQLASLCVVGEDDTGYFHKIHRADLTGTKTLSVE